MNDRHPEQVNPAVPSTAEDFTLESIMKEFGSSAPEEAVPQAAAETRVTDSTVVFTPVQAAPPEPQTEAPMKIAKLSEKASTPKVQAKPARTLRKQKHPSPEVPAPVSIGAILPTSEKKPVPEKKPPTEKKPEPPKASAAEPPKQPDAPIPRKVKSAPREPKLVPPPPEAPSPQDLMHRHGDSLGLIRLRLILLSFCTLLSLFITIYDYTTWEFLPLLKTKGALICLILLCLSLSTAFDVPLRALQELRYGRVSLYLLTTLAAALCLVLNFTRPFQDRSYCIVVQLLLTFQLSALYSEHTAMYFTLRTVCAIGHPKGIFSTKAILQNTPTLRRDEGNVEGFLKQVQRLPRPQLILCIFSWLILPLTALFAYFLSVSQAADFLQAWLLLLLGATPCAGAMCFVRPWALFARRLSTLGGALCSWHGARIFGGKHTIILRDEDLFPKNAIVSNGMKLYGSCPGPIVIGYALAVLEAAANPLANVFEQLLQSQYGKHYRVDHYRFYDNGGIGAEIGSDVVLVGSLAFFRSMGVHMPEGTRVRQAVYVSVNGELCGIFAIKYKPSAATKAGLADVLANRNFSVVLATRDFLITPELIAAKYELPTDALVFSVYSERIRLSEANSADSSDQGALVAGDTFGPFASTVAAGRSLRTISMATAALSVIAGLFGFILCALLLVWNAVHIASPFHLAAFQLLWAAVTLFIGGILRKF